MLGALPAGVGSPSGGEDGTDEERLTLWIVSSAELAIEQAETEAEEYVIGPQGVSNLRFAHSSALSDVPGDGAETFSLMRDSRLSPDDQPTTHPGTGTEREVNLSSDVRTSR
ncbi:hypothetical protein [Klenkia taihuensis]|uniref:Uncharacterized protein n=1 Tax=Klenkia taihuensis TaxID=1225127 RepID=A0A1I1HNI5_9ACTN|nr:hypothetical protein [Klenkia taihuensis]SFC23538.1 hypothetical protein SAMN05661030_0448 [Klenkia taihuensis]